MKPTNTGSLYGVVKLLVLVVSYAVIITLITLINLGSILVVSLATPPCVAAWFFIRTIRKKERRSDIIAHGITFVALMAFSLYLALSFALRKDDESYSLALSMIIYPVSALILVPWIDRAFALILRQTLNEKNRLTRQ